MMNGTINQPLPLAYRAIAEETEQLGFTMPSDVQTCALLRTLAASKPGGRLLELGTGSGLATAWILNGMDAAATLVSLDHDDTLLAIARNTWVTTRGYRWHLLTVLIGCTRMTDCLSTLSSLIPGNWLGPKIGISITGTKIHFRD